MLHDSDGEHSQHKPEEKNMNIIFYLLSSSGLQRYFPGLTDVCCFLSTQLLNKSVVSCKNVGIKLHFHPKDAFYPCGQRGDFYSPNYVSSLATRMKHIFGRIKIPCKKTCSWRRDECLDFSAEVCMSEHNETRSHGFCEGGRWF